MTRLMLGEGGRAAPGSGGKPRRENRRETWCPGAGAAAAGRLPVHGSALDWVGGWARAGSA